MAARALKRLTLRSYLAPPLSRHLYSVDGIWEAELTNAVRLAVEKRWLDQASLCLNRPDATEEMYVLSMFPYPSGRLHMGHVRVYTIGDAVARFHRLQGKKVLQPMGWDSFGLPAENAAVERGLSPAAWTADNVQHMRAQLDRLALSLHWDRQLSTSCPRYYRWTQWIFLQLFHAQLVYQAEARVNWDPVDGTVLADEQVDEQGRSWRSGAAVERRLLRQWFVRTTRFAQRLHAGLDDPQLKDWRDVVAMQRHWIGECNGWKLDVQVVDGARRRLFDDLTLWVDDLFRLRHVDCVAVRSDHPLASQVSSGTAQLVCLPAGPHGATFRVVPLVVHDDPPLDVVGIDGAGEVDKPVSAIYPEGMSAAVVCSHDNQVAGDICDRVGADSRPEKEQVQDFSEVDIGDLAVRLSASRCSSRLHDWLISRQRYWGTPIPVVHCRFCGTVPVPEAELPVELPDLSQLTAADEESGQSDGAREEEGKERGGKRFQRLDLRQAKDWINTECPKCGRAAQRETDTMDTFVDSSWYYLRYLDPNNDQQAFCPDGVRDAMPVDIYVGGKEHATLHLYYARFMCHFLHSFGLVNCREPFSRLLTQGQVMGQSYRVTETGQYLPCADVDLSGDEPVVKATGAPVTVDWEKMSKSKHNGVDPDSVLDEYGVDTTRLFMLATVAPQSPRNWSEDSFANLMAWQRRLWITVGEFVQLHRCPPAAAVDEAQLLQEDKQLRDMRNYLLRTTTYNMLHTHNISVAISRMLGLTTALRRMSMHGRLISSEYHRALGEHIIIVSTVMPCLAAELWTAFVAVANRQLCSFDWDATVHQQSWPDVDMDAIIPLIVRANHVQAELSLPRHQLDCLTEQLAVQLATAQLPEVAQQTAELLECQLRVQHGLGAQLNMRGTARPPTESEREEKRRMRKREKEQRRERKSEANRRKG